MSEMKLNKHQEAISPNKDDKPDVRRPYTPPRILSAEPLEAAAAICDPPSGGFGKEGNIMCNPATPGS